MAYSAYAVANAFIDLARAGRIPQLTPMKLQKLMYFAQVWRLRQRGAPLLDDWFSRWQYGPVIPAIYHEFKALGAGTIDRYATAVGVLGNNILNIPLTDTDSWDLLSIIAREYGDLDGSTLSAMTHAPGGAWAKNGPDGSPISYEEMFHDAAV